MKADRIIFWIIAGLLSLVSFDGARGQEAHYRHAANGALLPDPALTPGATIDVPLATLCRPGYSAEQRNVGAGKKHRVYAEYGATPSPGRCCEVDHLISLELGGSNDIANLWPQPYEPRPGAHEKDQVEDYLHRQVCSGRMPLAAAQHAISTDWTLVKIP